MKKSHFLGDWWFLCDLLCHFWGIFGWDWGTPAILRQNPNIYGQFQGKLGFGQFWKKVGTKFQLLPKICFGGFPYQWSLRCSKFVLERSTFRGLSQRTVYCSGRKASFKCNRTRVSCCCPTHHQRWGQQLFQFSLSLAQSPQWSFDQFFPKYGPA